MDTDDGAAKSSGGAAAAAASVSEQKQVSHAASRVLSSPALVLLLTCYLSSVLLSVWPIPKSLMFMTPPGGGGNSRMIAASRNSLRDWDTRERSQPGSPAAKISSVTARFRVRAPFEDETKGQSRLHHAFVMLLSCFCHALIFVFMLCCLCVAVTAIKTIKDFLDEELHGYYKKLDSASDYLAWKRGGAVAVLDPLLYPALAISDIRFSALQESASVKFAQYQTTVAVATGTSKGPPSPMPKPALPALDLVKILEEGHKHLEKMKEKSITKSSLRTEIKKKLLQQVRKECTEIRHAVCAAGHARRSLRFCHLLCQFQRQITAAVDSNGAELPFVIEPPTEDDNTNLDSLYCSIRDHATSYKGKQRTAFINAMKTLFPEMDNEDQEGLNDKAVANLRQWKAGQLPIELLEEAQARLCDVSSWSCFGHDLFLRLVMKLNRLLCCHSSGI